ncbi:MAG: hypothetical protein ACRC28_13275 [Clostridium sp.]|uniref:glycan biosynthesis hexose transferase WsfD n=1 Tax=Clostridium sp. TaxID=1506 RepID=UPI003F322597
MKKEYRRYLIISFILLAIGIITYVLFRFNQPMPGVADQGDFDRVMQVSRLSVPDYLKNNPDFVRFFKYTVTDYQIGSFSILNIIITLVSTSMAYLITLISIICKIFGQSIFKTQYLAIAYCIMYVGAMAIILKNINIKSKFKLTLLAGLMLFVFLNGDYLVWFNSIYGGPMMITTLSLFIAMYLYYVKRCVIDGDKSKLILQMGLIFFCAFIFLGSKLQVFTTLPAILFILGKIIYDNRTVLSKKSKRIFIALMVVITLYPMGINMAGVGLNHDTQFNSVFYGVLNGSKNPRQDLIDMGLDPAMAGNAGLNAYEPTDKYVNGFIPRTPKMKEYFYDEMSNSKLVKFYLTHPKRLIEGMQYVASKAFDTTTDLGKYPQSYSEKPIIKFDRFTTWENIRMKYFPKKLWFIGGVYLLIFAVSLGYFIKRKDNKGLRAGIIMLWCLMFMGVIQFPMPYVGNGRADTAKQLFLFNFIFDILVVTGITFTIGKIYDGIRKLVKR